MTVAFVGWLVPLTQKPNEVLDCPGFILAAQDGGVTMIVVPFRVVVPDHVDVIVVLVGRLKVSFQLLIVFVVVLRIVVVRQ